MTPQTPAYKNTSSEHLYYLDILRLLCIAFVVIDHSVRAYASLSGVTWWITDSNRSYLWDLFYFFENSFMVALLFIISGIFIPGSLERHGFKKFVLQKFRQLVIPYFVGIFILLPFAFYPLSGSRYASSESFLNFYRDVFLAIEMDPTTFFGITLPTFKFKGCISYLQYWFLMYNFLVAIGWAILMYLFPCFFKLMQKRTLWYVEQKPLFPYLKIVILGGLTVAIPGFYFGGHYNWVGYGKIFLFPPYYLFFAPFCVFLGIIMGLKQDNKPYAGLNIICDAINRYLPFISYVALVSFIVYGVFMFSNYDMIYDKTFYYKTRVLGYSWQELAPLIRENGFYFFAYPLIRGMCGVMASMILLGVFYKKRESMITRFRLALAKTSFDIYIWHCIPMFWLQAWFLNINLPGLFKGLFVAILSFYASFAISICWDKLKAIVKNK